MKTSPAVLLSLLLLTVQPARAKADSVATIYEKSGIQGGLVVSFNPGAAADQPAISQKIDLTVTDVTGLDMHRPVTGGVPLAEGAAVADSQFLGYRWK